MTLEEAKALPRTEKLRLLEVLWEDVSRDEEAIESPAWHGEALREAERLHAEGKVVFSDWQQAKERLRRTHAGR